MTDYTITLVARSDGWTDAPGSFEGSPGGWHLYGHWIGFAPDTVETTATISDQDSWFDDDEATQVLAQDLTVDGVTYPAGTMIESEYAMLLRDADGNEYRVFAVTAGGDAYNIIGFAFLGDPPPTGVLLQFIAHQDVTSDVDPYQLMAQPICLARGTRVACPGGVRRIEDLRPGDPVLTADHGTQPLRLRLRQRRAGREPPLRLPAGCFAPGLPRHDLILSPQHRILHRDGDGDRLIPVKALSGQGAKPVTTPVTYLNLAFSRHEVIFAEGLAVESFYPGPEALKALSMADLLRVRALYPLLPTPARPFIRPGQWARAHAGGARFCPVAQSNPVMDHSGQWVRIAAEDGP